MFLSAVIPLTVMRTVEGPDFLGRACYSFFLRQVARHDEDLATQLHRDQGLKCFTVSELMDANGWRRRDVINEGALFWLRFTSLDAQLTNLLQEKVLPALPGSNDFGPVTCRIETPLTSEEDHRWAGMTSSRALMDRWFGEEQIPASITFLFGSPTLSRRIRWDWVWPLPAVVFTSLIQQWNRYGDHPFDEGLVRLIEAEVFASHYKLRTERVRIGNGRFSGWLGRVRYRIFAGEPGFRAALHALADFALYCGVGYKTTQGMGQVLALR